MTLAASVEPQACSPAAGAPEQPEAVGGHPAVPAADEEAAGGKTPPAAEPTSGTVASAPEVQQEPSAVTDPAVHQGEEVPEARLKRSAQGKSYPDASTASAAEQEPLVGKHLEEATTGINGTYPQEEEILDPLAADEIPEAQGKSHSQPQLDSAAAAPEKPHQHKDHSKVGVDTEQLDKAVPQWKAELCATLWVAACGYPVELLFLFTPLIVI